MQRTQLILAFVAAVLLLVTAAQLGLEAVAPGQSLARALDLPMAGVIGQVHGVLGTIFAALVAASMAAVAVRDDGPMPGLVLALSGLLALAAIARAAVIFAPDAVAAAIASAGFELPGAEMLALWARMLGGGALGVILLAAGCLVGARPGYGWLGFFVQAVTMAVFTLYLVELASGGPGSSGFLALIPLLTLLALLSAQLADEDVPAAPYLFALSIFGMAVAVLAGLAPALDSDAAAPGPRVFDWLSFLAFVAPFFGLFAAMNRASPGQRGSWIWVHALGLAMLALPAAGPMTGVMTPAANASLWGFAFYGWVLLGLTVAVRRSVLRSVARGSE